MAYYSTAATPTSGPALPASTAKSITTSISRKRRTAIPLVTVMATATATATMMKTTATVMIPVL
jgi:hypothetical protein